MLNGNSRIKSGSKFGVVHAGIWGCSLGDRYSVTVS
jgi:hypothetical protein